MTSARTHKSGSRATILDVKSSIAMCTGIAESVDIAIGSIVPLGIRHDVAGLPALQRQTTGGVSSAHSTP